MTEKKYPKKDIPPIDYPSVLERIGGDLSFLEELLNLYFEDFSEKYEQLQKAIEQKKFNLIHELGHSLRGSSANLSLTFLQETSLHMEVAGRERNVEKAKKALALLEQEFERLKDFLSEKKDKFANISRK
jgi:HPt (histidine-containing phosphotransfer) domain-containing protein